ncbi:rho-related GTP-binding protein RhoN-like isoform X2 [Ornithodoros turicata]|uniref:rho-related GTP-binding protein RhoN-like isoform X2 n=1 Tax=Ornithodoros turicata TaxID=34597 RepID=UPI003138E713
MTAKTATVCRSRSMLNNVGVLLLSLEGPTTTEECPVKVVLVGDTRCGKTSLAARFITDGFTELYTPTGFERYSTSYDVGEQRINYSVWDTSGASGYDNVRPLVYVDTSVFLLCFDVGCPESLENVTKKWHPEVKKHCPSAAVVLVGCKSDARLKPRVPCVSPDEALEATEMLGAAAYVETSARCAPRSVRDAWRTAALAALGRLHQKTASSQTLGRNTRVSHEKHKNCVLM